MLLLLLLAAPAASTVAPTATAATETATAVGKDEVGAYSWEEVAVDWGVVPLCVLFAMSLIFCCLNFAYEKIVFSSEARQTWIGLYIGSYNRTPQRPRFVAVLELIQTVLSLLVAIQFIRNTYTLQESDTTTMFQHCSSYFFIFHFFFRGLQNEFRLNSLFRTGSLIDIATVPGLLWRQHDWLSLEYFRTISALRAYVRAEDLVSLHLFLGPISHRLLHMILELVAMVICFACAILTLEVLGDVPGLDDLNTLTSGMGEITVFDMIYWSIETLTTVGYGDYAPTTFLSKLLTNLGMVGAIVFFARQVTGMQQVLSSIKAGRGEFVPGISKHVVLVGGIVRNFDPDLLGGFLNELFIQSKQDSWPDLVIMGSDHGDLERFRSDVEDHFRNVQAIDSPIHRIQFVVGSPLVKKDLLRCRCDTAFMVYIVSNTSITETRRAEEEDKHSTLCALSFKRHFPKVSYRLALLQGKSVDRASGAEIQKNRVFSLSSFRGALLCECARCPGWSTMIEHLVTTCSPVLEDIPNDSWQHKFLQGRSMEIKGFLAADEFCGRPTNEFVREAYRRCGICILACARGKMELIPASPDARVSKDTVFWAMCPHSVKMKGIKRAVVRGDWATNWEEVFMRQRGDAKRSESSRTVVQARLRSIRTPNSTDIPSESLSSNAGRYKRPSVQLSDARDRLWQDMVSRRSEIMNKQASEGSNFALLLDFSGTWADVLLFLRKSREDHLPVKLPVIILSKVSLSEAGADLVHMLENNKDIAIFNGDPDVEEDLISCGAEGCCSIVCVASKEDSFADTDILLAYGLLHRLYLLDKTILLEFRDPELLSLMPNLPHPTAPVVDMDEEPVESPSMVEAPEISDPDCSYTFDQHFVSGGIFLPRVLGSLLGQTFRTRGIVEIVQSLTMPKTMYLEPKSNTRVLWQIRAPPWGRGRSYGDLFDALIGDDEPALPLGLRRGFAERRRTSALSFPCGGAESPLITPSPEPAGQMMPPNGFVLTNPRPEEVVEDGDVVFVLASPTKAERWAREGLLHNFGHAVSAAEGLANHD